MRRTALVVALAALLVLAGCADVDVNTSPTAAPSDQPVGTDSPAAATPADGGTPTNEPDRGIYGGTIEDPAAAADAHEAALESAGSFTYHAAASFDLASSTSEVNRTARVTGGGDVLTVATNAPTVARRTYVGGDEAYTWSDRDGSVDVDHEAGHAGNADRYFGGSIERLLAAANLTYRKETQAGGVTADLYTASTGEIALEDRAVSYFDPDAVDTASLSVAIGPNGVVRAVQYRVDAEDDRSVSLRVTYRSVGSTTQPSPEWLSEARSTEPGDQYVYLRSVDRAFVDRVRANHLFALVEGEPMVERFGAFEAALASGVTYREGQTADDVSVEFDDSAVSGSTDGEYQLYRYSESDGSLVRVESNLDGDSRVGTVEDGYFLVLHRPTYEGERNG
jgi:hypothetical protein